MKKHSLRREIFDTVVIEPVKQLGGGLLQESMRQIFGFAPTKKKKQSTSIHNHYHIHPDKRYYKAK